MSRARQHASPLSTKSSLLSLWTVMHTCALSAGVLAPLEPLMPVSLVTVAPERRGLPASAEEREAQRGEMDSADEIMN